MGQVLAILISLAAIGVVVAFVRQKLFGIPTFPFKNVKL